MLDILYGPSPSWSRSVSLLTPPPTMNPTLNPQSILFGFLAYSAVAISAETLFTSNFDGHTGVPTTGYVQNTSGSTTAGVTWTQNASVTAISGLTVISPGGGFVNQGTAFASGDNIYVNHNLNIADRANPRGYSLTFTIDTAWDLEILTVVAGHSNNTGLQNQAYSSDLTISLSGGTLGAPITQTKVQLNYSGIAYINSDFDLTGTTIGAGAYTLTVSENNMGGGGAYAVYDGITLKGNDGSPPPPAITAFTASQSYVTIGETISLSWETSGADSLSIDQGIGDVTSLTSAGSGSTEVVVNSSTTFTLSASNTNGTSTRSIEIASGPPRPNIVFFLADDYGPQDTSVPFNLDSNGNPKGYNFNSFYQTPNMESLAASGMRFTTAYAQSVCSPTRTGLMTGRNSTRHAVTDWVGAGSSGAPVNWRSSGMDATDVTLPQLLKGGGYRTIHVGKAHFGSNSVGNNPLNLGFDVNIGGNSWGHPHSDYMGTAGYGGLPGLSAYDGSIYLTRALTIEANKQIENAVEAGQPFFLNMSFYAVHAPFTTNPDASGNYSAATGTTHAAFATMVEGMDIAIGQIRQKLVDLGVAENTLMVFLGDNGSDSPAVTVNGLPSGIYSDFPMRGKKGSKWEGGVRVPMIASWAATNPANSFQQTVPIPANSVETDIVASWDIPVTLLKMAGLSHSSNFGEDGYDLSPYLSGVPGSHRPQEMIIHYPHVHRSNYFTTFREGDLKLIYNYQSNSHQLYNLAADPTESNDLAASQPETLTLMTRKLAQRLSANWGARGPLIPRVATSAPNGNVVSIPNNPTVDVDADGLADTAEDPDLDGLVDPAETDPDNDNTDGDNTKDGAEFRTGTDPLNSASDFRGILNPSVSGGMVITWPSKPGASYQVQTTSDLAEWPSSPLATVPADSTGITTSYTLPSSVDSARFYRITLLP